MRVSVRVCHGLYIREINENVSVDQISSDVAHDLHEILKCISMLVSMPVWKNA